ncbi:unnamed protein product [Cyprideis torosa]|uniref:alanine racemase n=1 Tax=Cyprideis torosa TaxID=163714 RepID=A0A7R8WUK5_9CRUS|nr:unnamed protein product [Cyprideis torosa]CAG0909637.1 unnamed protein product [Cyprideis torosa]
MPRSDDNREQLQRFLELSDQYSLPRSIANSAALIAYEASRMEWVRPGIALYGGNPFSACEEKPTSLQAVMTLEAPLAAINFRRQGAQIGYGGISKLACDTRVGVVSAGYADGYPRLAQPGTPVSVNGVLCPTLGRISMDMVCVDLNNAPDAQAGDRVELWGASVSVDTVAASAGTISYELLCNAGTVGLQRGASN